jgi:hypothetical protein
MRSLMFCTRIPPYLHFLAFRFMFTHPYESRVTHPVTIYHMRTCLSSHQPMATSYLCNLAASPSTTSQFMFIADTLPYESRVTHPVTIYPMRTCLSSHQPIAISYLLDPAAPILHISYCARLLYMELGTPVRVTRHTPGHIC